MPTAAEQLSPEYRELVESASLDWQVAQFIRWSRLSHEHSANEIKAVAICEIGKRQHGDAFLAAVEAY
jgi:hypothetical protein